MLRNAGGLSVVESKHKNVGHECIMYVVFTFESHATSQSSNPWQSSRLITYAQTLGENETTKREIRSETIWFPASKGPSFERGLFPYRGTGLFRDP
ncbi:hypothetical protein MAR_003716 [Mya arenaria]|uniref:Uncharacterized protein n=1 Tax=Mya arenaria TaxID=6604 RepID=A0ABY7G6X4_MYAAR|nr:hypothetical protein MAR_003716 [Mya arenaria]